MQERNRESRKRNHNPPSRKGRNSNEKSQFSKSKELSPVEKRNQRIAANKKKGQRADNRKRIRHSNKVSSQMSSTQSRQSESASGRKIQNKGKRSLSKSKVTKENKLKSKSVGKSALIFTNKDFSQAKYMFFGFGLIIAYFLLLASSADTLLSEGLMFIYLGFLLLKKPIIYSQGNTMNFFALGVICLSLTAFLPNVVYFFSDWRNQAVNQYDLNLGFWVSILPLKSFEAILVLSASILLFYHIAGWKLNNLGREVFLIILVGVSIVSGCIQYFTGNDTLSFLFSENFLRSPIKDYGENLNLFYLIGGLASLALFFDSYRSNKVISVLGFIGVLINLFFIIHNQSFFYFSLFYTLAFVFIIRLYLKGKAWMQKLLTGVLLSACLGLSFYLNQFLWDFVIIDLGGLVLTRTKELWWLLVGSIQQINIFGNGIATAYSVLPQLSPLELFQVDHSYRRSDLLALISDFGFIGIIALIFFSWYWLYEYFRVSKVIKMRHRFFYALLVSVLFIRFLLLPNSLSVGIILLMLIFFHLSLREQKDFKLIFSKKICQLMGVFWLCLGVFWIFISMANQPLLSDVRYRLSYAEKVDGNLTFEDLSSVNIQEKDTLIPKTYPHKYFLKSYQFLKTNTDRETIVKTLHKTAFWDRNNPRIFLNLGYLFSDFDLDLAIETWNAYFSINPAEKIDDYKSLIYYAKGNYELFLSLERLSYLSNEYALEFALLLDDLDFQKYIKNNSLDRFVVQDKSAQFYFLKRLLEEGFFDEYDHYIAVHKNNISNIPILEAIKEKELANFFNALTILRKHVTPEAFDFIEDKDNKFYFPRVFLQNYPDIEMGAVLIKKEMDKKNYKNALIYVEHILTMHNPPNYAYYWKAELLYTMKEYVDSWFAFLIYLEKIKIL